ncbi:DUF2931 family protein [Chryseobacterium sp. CT-SW4]|uniref:DUF2931 family protein n=1 Tax=Chryseobacterium sp. SW-1 TaxID=3157343 RepID=UPI003B02D637
MKDKTTLLNWILAISLSIILFSCHKEPTKFQWQPAISAPKFYPVAGLADFGNAGHRSGTAFDNGWGDQYGGVVSGSKYKEVPKEVYISYFSVVDGLEYSGKVQLPYDRLLQLFREQTVEKNPTIRLKVGMAPGGWIRVWFYSSKDGNIEIAKAQLKGIREDPTVGIALRSKTFEYWGGTYTYWQHHGIPYEAWANNEKEYTLYFDLEKSNKTQIGMSYVSLDGTYY